MSTLYLRNVPEEVTRNLQFLAQEEGQSVSAYAIKALTQFAAKARNFDLLDSLPDSQISPASILADLKEIRTDDRS